jgi:predicted small metal-binding protein
MQTFACKDMGFECDYTATAETKEELMQQIAAHGMEVHSLTEADMTPEMMARLDSVITEA